MLGLFSLSLVFEEIAPGYSMRLICIGDVALSGQSNDLGKWQRPLAHVNAEQRTRVLFNWQFPCAKASVKKPRMSGSMRRYVAPIDAVQVIKDWAPAVAGLANNHLMDGGVDGVVETVESLKRGGIDIVGGGLSHDEISRPWVWEGPEGRVGVLNWVTPETHPEAPDPSGIGPNVWPGESLAARALSALRQSVDWVVVYMHWSDECFSFPSPEDRVLAGNLLDGGADAVIGNHPHVIRGAEIIRDRPVFYSLGNFFFSDMRSPSGGWIRKQVRRNREALVVEFKFTRGKRLAWDIYSYWRGGHETRPDSKNRAVRRFTKVSRPLSYGGYNEWYRQSRGHFNRWGYRLQFRLPVIGLRGMANWLSHRSANLAKV